MCILKIIIEKLNGVNWYNFLLRTIDKTEICVLDALILKLVRFNHNNFVSRSV